MNYILWIIIYLIFAVFFAQGFKSVNRKMKNASALTILLEFFTAIFALILSPFFVFKLPSDGTVYLIVGIVTIIYAVTDRLNIEARYPTQKQDILEALNEENCKSIVNETEDFVLWIKNKL